MHSKDNTWQLLPPFPAMCVSPADVVDGSDLLDHCSESTVWICMSAVLSEKEGTGLTMEAMMTAMLTKRKMRMIAKDD